MKNFKSLTVGLMLLLGLATYSNAADMNKQMNDNKMSKSHMMKEDSKMTHKMSKKEMNISSSHQQLLNADFTTS